MSKKDPIMISGARTPDACTILARQSGTPPMRHVPFSERKWNESDFRPPLCTYRLNWARRTSWGLWDDWDDTVLQTQDSKFEPWRSEAEQATSRSRRLPTIQTFTRGWGRNIFCFFQTAETGNRTLNSGVKGSGANHYPRAPAPLLWESIGRNSLLSRISPAGCSVCIALHVGPLIVVILTWRTVTARLSN